jgi:hypothetical protein
VGGREFKIENSKLRIDLGWAGGIPNSEFRIPN